MRAVIVATIICFVVAVLGFVRLTMTGHPTDNFVAFVSLGASFLVPQLFTLVRTQDNKQKLDDVQQTLKQDK